ncbi:cobalt transporter [Dissulfurispira thermophila]|uniref:Cobalt transporter n=2 Tax=root TaxID=1 RepID=A0A7G1GZL1_9BACT|nr:PDGLE domain-containing protein [Dissulfurispira thermophila]BCB95935.1 cobalt transporter [Dissulfurispira thermophila]
MTSFQKKLWIGLIIMALLSPLGIILPEKFKAGDAWGEWGTDTLEKLLGYVPEGLKKLADLWKAPIADYNLGSENSPLIIQVVSYVISGILGIAIVGSVIYLISNLLVKKS